MVLNTRHSWNYNLLLSNCFLILVEMYFGKYFTKDSCLASLKCLGNEHWNDWISFSFMWIIHSMPFQFMCRMICIARKVHLSSSVPMVAIATTWGGCFAGIGIHGWKCGEWKNMERVQIWKGELKLVGKGKKIFCLWGRSNKLTMCGGTRWDFMSYLVHWQGPPIPTRDFISCFVILANSHKVLSIFSISKLLHHDIYPPRSNSQFVHSNYRWAYYPPPTPVTNALQGTVV